MFNRTSQTLQEKIFVLLYLRLYFVISSRVHLNKGGEKKVDQFLDFIYWVSIGVVSGITANFAYDLLKKYFKD